MGYKAVAVALHHSQARKTTKLVLVALAHFYDDEGRYGAYPSQKTLSLMANCDERTVRRALADLADMGEIDILLHQGVGMNPWQRTNRYRIILDCPDDCDGSSQHKRTSTSGGGGQILQPDRTKWSTRQDTYVRLIKETIKE